MAHTGATFADAAAEWLRYIEHDRDRKPSTVAGYRSIVGSELLPRFGEMRLESITPAAIESWQAAMTQAASTRTKALVLMHGIFEPARKVWLVPSNPVGDVEKPPLTRSGDLQVFSPEEVWALVRAAASEADARSSSRQPSQACGWGRCSRCAGAMSTSGAARWGRGPGRGGVRGRERSKVGSKNPR